ncbi:hypothetical protein NDU88_006877 [Pleurodeles waltl]|uniref:Uncharacterized protein n=1 Tax=Pleurodeles waltl TaxID=8319 RepID=A0AAV7SQR4_PLEWA|nr:hypothetical protein NDU88_006877 [Pleurodeles waltl]
MRRVPLPPLCSHSTLSPTLPVFSSSLGLRLPTIFRRSPRSPAPQSRSSQARPVPWVGQPGPSAEPRGCFRPLRRQGQASPGAVQPGKAHDPLKQQGQQGKAKV